MMKPVRFVCGVGLFLSILACGGGGASVSQNQYAGTWVGTGTWQTYNAAEIPQGSQLTGLTVDGTVSANGDVNLAIRFGAGSSNIYDNIRGTVSGGGNASGTYLDGVPENGIGGNVYTYTAVFNRAGNQLNVTYRAEYGGSFGSARGTLVVNLQ